MPNAAASMNALLPGEAFGGARPADWAAAAMAHTSRPCELNTSTDTGRRFIGEEAVTAYDVFPPSLTYVDVPARAP